MNIYVGNLPFTVNEGEIEQVFTGFGAVESVKIVRDRDSGRSKGFSFVIMNDDTQAQAAIAGLNGTDFKGRNLVVNEARPRENSGGGFRPQGGGGGGRRGGGGGGGFNRDRY